MKNFFMTALLVFATISPIFAMEKEEETGYESEEEKKEQQVVELDTLSDDDQKSFLIDLLQQLRDGFTALNTLTHNKFNSYIPRIDKAITKLKTSDYTVNLLVGFHTFLIGLYKGLSEEAADETGQLVVQQIFLIKSMIKNIQESVAIVLKKKIPSK